MPWIESCAMEQRIRFVVEYDLQELTMAELCRKYTVSRKTGYKWLSRARDEGFEGLADRSRAPHTHVNQVSDEIEQAVLAMRAAHPTWGPKKVLRLLENQNSQIHWPVRSTIAEILRRNGLVVNRKRRRRVPPYEKPFSSCGGPNDIWCVDFKGWFKTQDGSRCDPLTMTDAHSRYILRCQVVSNTGQLGVRPVFEAAFREYGLPRAIRSDNGPPFASRGLSGLSRLSVWWIKLGIEHERIQPGKPQQNGRHERMHLTLKCETCSPSALTLRAQQRRFDAFRKEFNELRPHEALELATPNELYELSARPYPSHEPQMNYPADWLCRRVRKKGGVKFKGIFFLSHVLAGETVGFEPIDGRYWRVHFGPKALGIFDLQLHRMLSVSEAKRAGLSIESDAGNPPSAALQEDYQP